MEPLQSAADMTEENFETELNETVVEPLNEETGMDEMIEDEDSEKSDSVTGMSAVDKEKHKLEYLQLIKEIEAQNKIVDELKEEIMKSCERPGLTKCELREIKKLRACVENENLKLQCMLQRAIQMQNENPSHLWKEIPIVTTFEEDVYPQTGNCNVMGSLGLMRQGAVNEKGDLCNVCSKRSKNKKHSCRSDDDLNSETCQLFEEMAHKDQMVEFLSNKLHLLQRELYRQGAQTKKSNQNKRAERLCGMGESLEEKISSMQDAVEMLKADIKRFCKEKRTRNEMRTGEPIHKKANDLRQLKQDYAKLLVDYAKKERQLMEFENRSKSYCGGKNGGNSDSVDEVELKLLREKVNDLRDEQDEYTCIIKEQAEQLDDYRKKYLDAQQKVEEQKCMLEKIDMNNKRIEGQIEGEVKRIKAKFREQLSELSQYPKLLENEQIKLASACKDREELEGKLIVVCKELKTLKEQMTTKEDKPDCSQKLAKYEQELILLQNKTEELDKEKAVVCEQLLKAQQDLDTMRSESAKIITSTKERFEMSKISMCSQIDTLEKELAQCRANAYLSVTDREAVIKEMQSQLSTLSYSFDSAQKQIKTLKNHISFLSNDQCIPIKC